MKNLIYTITMLAFIVACGSSDQESTEEVGEAPEEGQKYSYSGSFEMGDKANFAIIRQWNEAFINSDMETISSLLADSVEIYLWDGMTFITTGDSLVSAIEGYLGSITNLEIIYHAGTAVRSTKQGDDWAMSWATEKYTDADGNQQQVVLQENYLIEDGKIRSMRQYAQQLPEGTEIEATDGAEFTYSGSFEKADDSLNEVVLGWNNALASPTDLEAAAGYLADSVTFYSSDGEYINASKDSIMNMVRQFTDGAASVKVDFDAIIPVRITDKNEDWVLSWTDESWTDNEGKEEHMWIHEDYLIEDGKIRMVRQYSMKEKENDADEATE